MKTYFAKFVKQSFQKEIDCEKIKLAIISIFWRMGVTTHKLFTDYNLGIYTEKLRAILDQGIVPPDNNFPILISKGILEGNFQRDILFPIGRGRYDKKFIMQSVVLNGIVFDCLMNDKMTIPSEILYFSLKSNGQAIIANQSYDQLGLNIREFSKRVSRNDVKEFYDKYA